MTNRSDKIRKKARKARNRQRKEDRRKPGPDEPVNHERVLARYRYLTGRGVKLGFVPIAPTVKASTPEELERATVKELIKASAGEPSN